MVAVKLYDLVRVYKLDWQALSALIVPIIFGIMFPVYFFGICPLIWSSDPDAFRPRSWIIGYWLFASLVWFIFLAICFHRMRNGEQLTLRGMRTSDSTEDIWSEDKYFPETYFQTPEYFVSVTAVQPSSTTDNRQLEVEQEIDETWDYNFEDHRQIIPVVDSSSSKLDLENSKCKALNLEPTKISWKNKLHEPFELSSDEENPTTKWTDIFQLPVKIQHANEISGQKLPNSCTKKIGEVNYLKLKSFETDSASRDSTAPIAVTDDNAEPNGNLDAQRKDSIVTDAKFDLILASLQSLAVEIERDFHNESEAKFSKLGTKSESRVTKTFDD